MAQRHTRSIDIPSRLPGYLGWSVLFGLVCFLHFTPPSDESASTRTASGSLKNGVRYVVASLPSPDHRLIVALSMQVGAQDERPDEAGISHYLEHMAFNGAGEFGPKDIEQWLRAQGLSTARDENASTDESATTFRLSIPDNSPSALEHALKFLAAVASQMHLEPTLIDKERPIILTEMRMRDTPEQQARDNLRHFDSDGRSQVTPVIGTVATVSSFHREQLLSYYRRNYRPDRATVEVLGNVDKSSVALEIEKTFGEWQPAPNSDAPAPPPPAPDAAANAFQVIAAPHLSASYLALSRIESLDQKHPSAAFENDLYSRLFTAVLEHRLETAAERGELAYSNSSETTGLFLRDFLKTDIQFEVSPENWRESLARVWEQVRGIREQAVSPSELSRATSAVFHDLQKASPDLQAENPEARERYVRAARLSPEGIADPAARLALAQSTLRRVTPVSFQTWMGQHAPATGWHFALVANGDAAFRIPSQADLQDVVARSGNSPLEPWHDDESITALLPEKPSAPATPAPIAVDSTFHVTTMPLPNNVTVHYRRMKECGNQIIFTVSIDGGEVEETTDNRGVTQLAAAALRSAATRHFTSLQMADWIKSHGMTWSVSTERNSVLLTLHAPASEAEAGFQFLHVVLTEVVLRPDVMARWQNEMTAFLRRQGHDPLTISAQRARANLFGDDARLASIPVTQLRRLTREEGQAWLDHLLTHAVVEAGVVANLPDDAMVNLTSVYLGSLPEHPRVLTEPRLLPGPVAAGPRIERDDVPAHLAAATITFHGASLRNTNDFYGLQLISQVLQDRLLNKVREKSGMAYFVDCVAEPGLGFQDSGFFLIAFASSDEKVDSALGMCQAVLQDFIASGPSTAEVATTLKRNLRDLNELETSPEHWAWSLSHLQINDVSLDSLKNRPNDFQHEANRDELLRVARLYLSSERAFTAVAMDRLPLE